MEMEEAVALVHAVARFAYNAELGEFNRLFPFATKDYLLEKYKLMQKDVGAFFGQLDSVNSERFISLAVERYNQMGGEEIFVRGSEDG